MMTCGVYMIRNRVSLKIYIGSSRNVESRLNEHRYDLANNQHKNKHLQHSYNLHGLESFSMYLVEETSLEDLIPREQAWINAFKKTNELFNIRIIAENNTGIKQNLTDQQREAKRLNALSNDHFSSKITSERMKANWENDRDRWKVITKANLKKGQDAKKKSFIVVFPDKTKKVITGLRSFCKDHNLPYNKVKLILSHRRNPPNKVRVNRRRNLYINGYSFYDYDPSLLQ